MSTLKHYTLLGYTQKQRVTKLCFWDPVMIFNVFSVMRHCGILGKLCALVVRINFQLWFGFWSHCRGHMVMEMGLIILIKKYNGDDIHDKVGETNIY